MKCTRSDVRIGQQIGPWRITGKTPDTESGGVYLCRCHCGKERLFSASTVKKGALRRCSCNKGKHNTRVSELESSPLPASVQDIFQMINRGYLPPADQFSVRDGSPAWTLPSLAGILGISPDELLEHINRAGQRFSPIIPGAPHIEYVIAG
ncbi:MAG: hypothetical protein ACK443_09835 [Methylococcaceae bacterium]|jgi:hypothetical protein